MKSKYVFLIALLFFYKPMIGISQTICQPVTDDLKKVLALAFTSELNKKDSIILRRNFNSICIEEAFDRNKIKLWSERKLFNSLYQDFYSIEEVQITNGFARVTYLQRSNNFIFVFLFFKKEDGNWQISNERFKRQARIKGDDYLLYSIRKALKNK
ncbi:MAG: hypothetical protein ACX93O_13250 [Flagellimonas sp.]